MILLACALAAAAALAAATALRLRAAQRREPPAPAVRAEEPPLRLRQIAALLQDAGASEHGVNRSLRPFLLPIASARLARRGVDLTLAPARARELLGDEVWEIVRPDRPQAGTRVGRGIAAPDLASAIERLEQL
jgi:hypothetical protein